MSKDGKIFIVIGCLLLATAGSLSAFGFHGPDDMLTVEERVSWGWAVEMQYYHALGLILVGILANVLGRLSSCRWRAASFFWIRP